MKDLATAYGELGTNYNYMTDYEHSVNYLLKAIDLYKSVNNKRDLYTVKQKLASTYLAQHNYKFAIDLYRECLPEFKSSGLQQNYYITLINLGDALTRTKQYTEAKKVLTEAEDGLKIYDNKELLGICEFRIAELEAKLGNKTQALANYQIAVKNLLEAKSARIVGMGGDYINYLNRLHESKKALSVIDAVEASNKFKSANKEDQLNYQNAIAETYKATNNDKEAIKAYQNTITIMDSIASAQKNIAVQEIQANFKPNCREKKTWLWRQTIKLYKMK